jgi:Flp pilus assembly protein TadG
MWHMNPQPVSRRLRDHTGSTLVEAALVTPLVLLLTFSIIEFASLFYVYLALENGVSQATRYAVTGNLMDDPENAGTPLSREGSIKAALREATPTLTISDADLTFSHLPPGGNAWLSGTGGPGDIEKVTVNHTWTFFTPLMRPFFEDGQITLEVESSMKNEGRFQ